MYKVQLMSGDSATELREPENHEDGDPEVRDGRQGKRKKERCRKTESEIDTKRDSGQTHKEKEETGKQRNSRDPE